MKVEFKNEGGCLKVILENTKEDSMLMIRSLKFNNEDEIKNFNRIVIYGNSVFELLKSDFYINGLVLVGYDSIRVNTKEMIKIELKLLTPKINSCELDYKFTDEVEAYQYKNENLRENPFSIMQ